jgi:hypothetical protein
MRLKINRFILKSRETNGFPYDPFLKEYGIIRERRVPLKVEK